MAENPPYKELLRCEERSSNLSLLRFYRLLMFG